MSLMDKAKGLLGGGGGGGQDFWKPKKGTHQFRIFRFLNENGEKELYHERVIHFQEKGKPPMNCPEDDTCPICRTVSLLQQVADEQSKEKARRLRSTRRGVFAIVLRDNPKDFSLWEASEGTVRKILCLLAVEGGHTGTKFPSGEGDELESFLKCAEAGIEVVTGGKGMDIVLTYDPSARPADMYDVIIRRGPAGAEAIPFDESKAPNPKESLDRIQAAMEKKRNGGSGGKGEAERA